MSDEPVRSRGEESAYPQMVKKYVPATVNAGGINKNTIIEREVWSGGLTIREEFAKAAMIGILSSYEKLNLTPETVARYSVEQADALIAALAKLPPDGSAKREGRDG